MTIERRIEKLEENAPQEPINIPISAWGFGKDRTEVERLTGIVFKWAGEDEICAERTNKK